MSERLSDAAISLMRCLIASLNARRFAQAKTEADYQAWRDQRDFTARKYAKRTRGEKLDSEIPSSLMRCACGVRFDSHVHAMTLIRAPHIYAAQAEKRRRG